MTMSSSFFTPFLLEPSPIIDLPCQSGTRGPTKTDKFLEKFERGGSLHFFLFLGIVGDKKWSPFLDLGIPSPIICLSIFTFPTFGFFTPP